MPNPRTQELLNFKPVSNMPNTLQIRCDPTSELPIYVGQAPYGFSASSPEWTIYKFTYSGNFFTLKQTAVGVAWDDRATVTYA